MQITIDFDEGRFRNTLAALRGHFPALPEGLEEQLRGIVWRVAQQHGLPVEAAVKLVVAKLLSLRPELVKESVELAEEQRPATGWRELRRKVSRSVARTFGRPVTKREALEALAKSVERKEL